MTEIGLPGTGFPESEQAELRLAVLGNRSDWERVHRLSNFHP
ncbi:MAG TPA: hypothetical protein VHU86_12000 [Solirubrobacterales bacterium]|jgi:hypothetical protein|nr:hypothetical protein [Solirubrobacterales bacterium]